MAPGSIESEDSDVLVVGRDDIINYNPEQVLPESAETIEKIRSWLQPTAYDLYSGEYRKYLGSHAPGSGMWVTESQPYKQWLHGETHGLLWIKGIPGSRKSVMTSKLVRGLSGSPPLLRDWLDQILSYSPPLQKQLKEYMDNNRALNTISMAMLWTELRLALAGLGVKAFCVADALDEMDQDQDEFLGELSNLGKWKPGKVKVLITS
jgi:hypothetical protein